MKADQKNFIIVLTFSEGNALTLTQWTNKDGAFWGQGFYGAKGFTLKGAEAMATRICNRHGYRLAPALPGAIGVRFMKIGSAKFQEIFEAPEQTGTPAAKDTFFESITGLSDDGVKTARRACLRTADSLPFAVQCEFNTESEGHFSVTMRGEPSADQFPKWVAATRRMSALLAKYRRVFQPY